MTMSFVSPLEFFNKNRGRDGRYTSGSGGGAIAKVQKDSARRSTAEVKPQKVASALPGTTEAAASMLSGAVKNVADIRSDLMGGASVSGGRIVGAVSKNGEVVGVANETKGVNSLARKISTAIKEGDTRPVEEVAAGMKDTIRYTLQLPQGKYAEGTNKMMDHLRDQGHEVVEIKNYWRTSDADGGPYHGINAVLRNKGGQLYELQFHTAASLYSKAIVHKPYEEFRETGVKLRRQQKLFDLMADVWKENTPVPRGALSIGKLKHLPRPV